MFFLLSLLICCSTTFQLSNECLDELISSDIKVDTIHIDIIATDRFFNFLQYHYFSPCQNDFTEFIYDFEFDDTNICPGMRQICNNASHKATCYFMKYGECKLRQHAYCTNDMDWTLYSNDHRKFYDQDNHPCCSLSEYCYSTILAYFRSGYIQLII